MSPLPPKLTRPRVAGSLMRDRLFSPLDRARRSGGVLWVSGQPGAGKTTLVASWITRRRIPTLWFTLDRADADPATFLHHLGLSLRSRTRRPVTLPPFKVAAGDDVSLFARRWFRSFYGALPRATVIVLDDYHELPAESPIHGLLRVAFEELPRGLGVIVSSRGEPPTALARMLAYGTLSHLAADDLQLTPEEAWELARLRRFGGNREQVETLRQSLRGWAAGFVLLTAGSPEEACWPRGQGAAFNFFSGEILDRFDPRTRRILLEAALLDAPTAEVLKAATGDADAGRVLSGLVRRGLFTLQREGDRPAFEFHALFREFLLHRGRDELPPGRANAVRRAAGLALAARGGPDAERAFALLVEAGASEEAIQVVLREAPRAVAAGRAQVVRDWVESIPEQVRDTEPWLLYWGGVAAGPRDPRSARRLLERAFREFVVRGDAAGTWLAWAGVVEATLFEATDLSIIDGWLAELPKLRDRFPLPSRQVEVRVTLAVLAALIHHAPDHPELETWTEAGRAIALDETVDVPTRLLAGSHYLMYSGWWLGDPLRSGPVVAALGPLARRKTADPSVAVLWFTVEAPYHSMIQDGETGGRTVAEGTACARASGVHAWDVMLYVQVLWNVLGTDDVPAARAHLAKVPDAVRPGNAMDLSMRYAMEAIVAMRAGDFDEAERSAREAVELAENTGHAVCAGMARMVLARAERGGDGAALAAARAMFERLDRPPFEHMLSLIEAERALEKGELESALEALRRALRLQSRGTAHAEWLFSAPELAPLCALALEHGVEPAAARRLIAARRVPPDPGAGESWPRPVHMRAFGAFEVIIDGVPMHEGKRGAGKPLELLKMIVAHGGCSVAQVKAAEALWPDADGDDALHSLETTLYRLRRLVGQDTIVQRGGMLSLSPERCWVDVLELESRIAAAQAIEPSHHASAQHSARVAARMVELYRGPLLDGHEAMWATDARHRQRRILSRWLSAMAGVPGVEAAANRLYLADPELETRAPSFAGD